MKKIAVIFTSFGPLVNNFKKILNDTLEDCELICIADDSLIRDVMRTGAPDENVEKRTFLHIESAIAAGAQMVVIACSSVGQVVNLLNKLLMVFKILKVKQVSIVLLHLLLSLIHI